MLIIVLYVGDMFYIGNNNVMIRELEAQLSIRLDMKDLEAPKYILGMKINRDWILKKI